MLPQKAAAEPLVPPRAHVHRAPRVCMACSRRARRCMPKEEQTLVASRATTSIGDDPLGFLLGLVLGSTEMPLEREERDFLASATASYLDPFIDGEVITLPH